MGGLGSTGTGTGVIGTHSKVYTYVHVHEYIYTTPPHGVEESSDVDHFSQRHEE